MEFIDYAGPVDREPKTTLYLVTDHTDYSSDDVIAVFTDETVARTFADTKSLYCDSRSIAKAVLNRPDFYPESIDYFRKR